MVDKIGRPIAQLLLVLGVSFVAADLLDLTLAWAVPYAVAALVAGVLFRALPAAPRDDAAHRADQELQGAAPRVLALHLAPEHHPHQPDGHPADGHHPGRPRCARPPRRRSTPPPRASSRSGQFGTQAIQQVLQPKFTALLAHDEHDALKDVYRISAAWSMAVAWPMYVGVASAPLVYLGLFGQEYVDDGLAVVLLMAGAQLFAVATGPCDTLLLMSGRSTLSLANSLTALALDVTLCVLLIPEMGITGCRPRLGDRGLDPLPARAWSRCG